MTAPTKEPERDTIDFDQDTRIKLSDGRIFKITEATSSRQDMWVMTRLDKAGLETIAAKYNSPDKLDEMAVKCVEAAYENGTLYEILAGILVEDGVKWTQDRARANAEYFSDLTNKEDKAEIQGPIVSILMLYFASGLASTGTSLKSSEMGSEASPVVNDAATSSAIPSPDSSSPTGPNVPVPESVLAALRGAGSTLVTTTSSPEKSPDTTTTDSKSS
jgi:hypothetical protein